MTFARHFLLASVSIVALLRANDALAVDAPFTTYSFPADGAPTSRTLPARLAEIKNVKDFGAIGNGVTDDLAAITAAYNWTASTIRGSIYFPPGTYYVSAPIDISLPGNASGVIFRGHMGLSTIVGNFADYVIKRAAPGSQAAAGQGFTIERLTIINQHATGGGIRLGGTTSSNAIRDCDITANFGINTANDDNQVGNGFWGSLEVSIENCNLRPYSTLAANSCAIMQLANGAITNCRIVGSDTGMRLFGGEGAMAVQGCYFEGCNLAFAPAIGPAGQSSSVGSVTVSGCRFKNNKIAIGLLGGYVRYSGILIEAAEGTIAGNPQYGIRINAGSGGGALLSGIKVTGQYQVAGIYLQGAGGIFTRYRERITFMGVQSINTSTLGGVNWVLPATAMTAEFFGCNVAPVYTMATLPAQVFTITSATWSAGTATITVSGMIGGVSGVSLNVAIAGVTLSGYNGTFNATGIGFATFTYSVADPGGAGSGGTAFIVGKNSGDPNVSEGECYNVSNATTATWGAAVTPGSGSNHAKVRFTPQAWTVVGK